MSHRHPKLAKVVKVAALAAASISLGLLAAPAAHAADWTYWHSTLDVQYPSAGTITSDQSDSGNSINCGSDSGSPGPCTVIDSVPGGDFTRPTTGWYSYTLHATGGPSGYSWKWTSGCSGVSPTCTIVNDQDWTTVSGEWVDTERPVIDVAHVPGVTRLPAELYASAHDNSGSIDHYWWVVCRADGSFCIQGLDHTGNIAYVTDAPDGDYVVSAFPFDAAGNGGYSSVGTLMTIDTVAPTLRITSPAANATVDAFAPAITFSATDPNLQDTRCSIDGIAQIDCYSGWSTGYLANGTHTVTVEARDKAGNATTATRRFTVVEPQVTLLGRAQSSYGDTARVAVQVPANSYGVVDFSDATTGAPLCSVPATPSGRVACEFDGTRYPIGQHDVFVRFSGDGTHSLALATFTYTVLGKPVTLTGAAQTGSTTTSYPLVVTGLPVDATGTVEFRIGKKVLGTTSVFRDGAATIRVRATAVDKGSYRVTATYSGDSQFAAASTTFPLRVR